MLLRETDTSIGDLASVGSLEMSTQKLAPCNVVNRSSSRALHGFFAEKYKVNQQMRLLRSPGGTTCLYLSLLGTEPQHFSHPVAASFCCRACAT